MKGHSHNGTQKRERSPVPVQEGLQDHAQIIFILGELPDVVGGDYLVEHLWMLIRSQNRIPHDIQITLPQHSP